MKPHEIQPFPTLLPRLDRHRSHAVCGLGVDGGAGFGHHLFAAGPGDPKVVNAAVGDVGGAGPGGAQLAVLGDARHCELNGMGR